MIIDLTDAFYTEAATSRTAHTQSNWHSSQFIKTSTSYLANLTSLQSKLNDLQKCVRSGNRFQKEAETKRILNVKQHLKGCEQDIKRLKIATVDIKSRRQTAEKLKESILIAMELKLLQATFRFKEIHLTHARKANREPTSATVPATNEREIKLNKPLFLEESQTEVLQETAMREYKEIEKSIHEISEMYKETVSVVRLQELLIDNIDGYIDDADANVKSGRRNLSELNSKEQSNRKLIYKVFGFLYFTVFVYLVFLS